MPVRDFARDAIGAMGLIPERRSRHFGLVVRRTTRSKSPLENFLEIFGEDRSRGGIKTLSFLGRRLRARRAAASPGELAPGANSGAAYRRRLRSAVDSLALPQLEGEWHILVLSVSFKGSQIYFVVEDRCPRRDK